MFAWYLKQSFLLRYNHLYHFPWWIILMSRKYKKRFFPFVTNYWAAIMPYKVERCVSFEALPFHLRPSLFIWSPPFSDRISYNASHIINNKWHIVASILFFVIKKTIPDNSPLPIAKGVDKDGLLPRELGGGPWPLARRSALALPRGL